MTYTIEPPQEQSAGRYTIEPPPAEEASVLGNLGRQVALTGRNVVEGAAALPGIFANPITATGNLAKWASNSLLGTSFERTKLPTEALSDLLTKIGLPQAQTGPERLAGDITRGAAGAAGGVGVGNAVANVASPIIKALGAALAASPGMQAISGATGGGAAGATRELGGGDTAQLVAGLAGGLAPSAVQAAGSAAIRGAVRGGAQGQQNYADRLQAFEDAGTTPSVGQASGSRPIQSVESALAQVSSSAGVLDRTAEREARDMGAKVESLANDLIPKPSATKTGRTIQEGISKFVDRFRAEQNFLYSKLDQVMPTGAPVPVSNLATKLDELTKPIAGAENVSAGLQNPTIAKLKASLDADAPNGQLPYQAIKELRTTIGEKISNPKLTDDVGTAQWKQLYGALSSDMEAAANAAGPDATRAFNRANAYTRAGHQRIEGTLQTIAGKDTAEQVYLATVRPSELKEGASTINAVLRSMEPEERKSVTATVIRRMGQALPGQQDNLGDQFSSQRFLTAWNNISPEARLTLFPDAGLRDSMDQIAKASNMVKQGSKVFANPSGTAPALSNQLSRWTMAGAIITGHPGLAAGFGALLAGTNLTARLLTNPDFVRWLAKTTTTPPAMIPAQINMLSQYAATHWKPEDRADLDRYLSGIVKTEPMQPPQ